MTDLNNSLLDKLPGETREHLSDHQHLPDVRQRDKVCGTECLNKLAPSRLPEHRLVLKVGAPVQLLRNTNLSRGQCNGSRHIVRNMRDDAIKLENVGTGDTMWLFRTALMPQDRKPTPLQFKRSQFLEMSTNKAQGQSFKHIGVCVATRPTEADASHTLNVVYEAVLHAARESITSGAESPTVAPQASPGGTDGTRPDSDAEFVALFEQAEGSGEHGDESYDGFAALFGADDQANSGGGEADTFMDMHQ